MGSAGRCSRRSTGRVMMMVMIGTCLHHCAGRHCCGCCRVMMMVLLMGGIDHGRGRLVGCRGRCCLMLVMVLIVVANQGHRLGCCRGVRAIVEHCVRMCGRRRVTVIMLAGSSDRSGCN